MKKNAKLRGKIIEKYSALYLFAKAIDERPAKVSQKLNGYSEFKKSDIEKWRLALEIEVDEIGEYFF